MNAPRLIASAQNPLVQRLRKLIGDAGAYRRWGQCWLEGEHLVAAAQVRGQTASVVVMAQSALLRGDLQRWALAADDVVTLPDALWSSLATVPAAQGIAWVLPLPEVTPIDPTLPTVVLDRLQDAGNVGSILRSAAALGAAQLVALKGTAGLWSPKVLRAGMGAHWALRLHEGLDETEVLAQPWALVSTSSHGGELLHQAALPAPCAWVFGNEGQGVSPALLAGCRLRVAIPQPGGEESLNAAAAAAICLYETMRRGAAPPLS
jgi:RNA methyltransferase, TrmH family